MPAVTTINISSVGLNSTDNSVLKVAINLLEKGGASVRLLEKGDTSGNVLLLDVDTEEGQALYKQLHTVRGQTLVLLTARTLDDQAHLLLKKPLRVQTLRDTVYDIYTEATRSVSLSLPGKPPAAAAPAPPAAPFDPENNLFFILLAAREEKKVLQIFYPPFPALYVDTANGVVATSASRESLRKMVRSVSASGRMNVLKLSLADFEILARGQIIVPLPNFLWGAALFGSQGQLIRGHSADVPVRLKGWPNLSRVDFEPEHMTLASVMARQAMSLRQIQEKTKIAFERVVGFYNAAWVTGLIEANPSNARAEKAPAEPKRSGLLAKLAKRLNLDAKFTSG